MTLFSKRWQLEHWLPRDPKIDEDANHEPIHGDVLAFDSEVGKFVSATPPVQPGIGDVINDGDLIVWDATDSQLEPITPTVDVAEVGTVDSEARIWNDGAGVWEASGFPLLEPAYGTISVAGGVATQAVTSTAALLTGFDNNGPSNLLTVDHLTDSITVEEDGTYNVQFSAAYSHAAATGVFFGIRIDGVGTAYQTNGVADDTVSLNGMLQLVAGEVVTVYVSNNVGGDGNLTLTDAQLTLIRIGE